MPMSWNHFLNQPGGSVVTLVGVVFFSLLGLAVAWKVSDRLDRHLRQRWTRPERKCLAVVVGMVFTVTFGIAFGLAMGAWAPGPVNGMEVVSTDDGAHIVVHFAIRGDKSLGLEGGTVTAYRVDDGEQTAELDLTRWGDDLSLVRIHNNLALGREGSRYVFYDYSTLRPVGDLAELAKPHLPGPLENVSRFTSNSIKLVGGGYSRWVSLKTLLRDRWDFSREVRPFSPGLCHLSRVTGVSLPEVEPQTPVLGLAGVNRKPCIIDTPEGSLTLAFSEAAPEDGGKRIMYGLVDTEVQWVRNIDDWVASNESFELLAPELSEDGLHFYWLRAGLSLSRYSLDPMSGALNDSVTYF